MTFSLLPVHPAFRRAQLFAWISTLSLSLAVVSSLVSSLAVNHPRRCGAHHSYDYPSPTLQDGMKSNSCHPTKLYSSSRPSIGEDNNWADTKNSNNEQQLTRILKKYGFGSRIVTITSANLAEHPMPAELYEGGSWKLCLVLGWKSQTNNNASTNKPPLVDILVMNEDGLLRDRKVVDIGQITTLWHDIISSTHQQPLEGWSNQLQSNFHQAHRSLQNNIFPIEQAMQNLYNGRIAQRLRPPPSSRHRNFNSALTKKQIPKVASQYLTNPSHLEELLRNLLKVGNDRMSRMVDSTMGTDYLYSDYGRKGIEEERIVRRMVAAQVLTDDALAGGRFKRRSCQFVSALYYTDEGEGDGGGGGEEIEEVTIVNGGWIAVDPSVKAGTEGRKFAAVATASTNGNAQNPNGRDDETSKKNAENPPPSPLLLTAADERIIHRLECLAMGDASWATPPSRDSSSQHGKGEEEEKLFEVDVRAALTSMNLPLTSQGAERALVQIGRWSEKDATANGKNKNKPGVEPWSPELLDAARSLAQREEERRTSLAQHCFISPANVKKKKGSKSSIANTASSVADSALEGRVNISTLPCVCIDARHASFRDDSIGIRLRSSTGRKVNKLASKWEILVHIADVSDLYFEGKSNDVDMSLLREAAERRGQSRYDLPLGPLHLLPPVALIALSLVTNQAKTPNRCVTLWAYIDERNGKLLEAGLERTIISSPIALSFNDATSLLESKAGEVPKSMTNTKAVLSVAERTLLLWSNRHKELNQAAQKKEKRYATKELISKELNYGMQIRDDGAGGSFKRTRGHRTVDASLDLYAFAVGTLMKRAKQPIPRAAGSGADRGGRLGTAPLRRYIDGIAQRQALSVLCGYGVPLTQEECREATRLAARARDSIDNLRSSKQSSIQNRGVGNQQRQVSALYSLARHLASTGGVQNQQQVKALSTGYNNEVVILGVGATGTVKGVKGTLKNGEKLLVRVDKIDPEKGLLNVSLVH